MTGLRAALALGLLCAPALGAPRRAPKAPEPAPAPAAPDPDELRMKQAMERVDAVVAKAKPVVDKLAAMRGRYADGDLDALDAERAPLVRELESRREEIREGIDEFKALRKEFQFRQGAALLSAIAGGASQDVQASLKRVLDFDSYPKEVSRFTETLEEALRLDHAAFAEAAAAREAARRRVQLAAGIGVGGAALAGGVFFLARRARRRRLETLRAVPVAMTPVPALQAAGGGALPGGAALRALTGPGPTPAPRRADPAPGSVLGGSWRIEGPGAPSPLGPVFEASEASGRRKVLVRRLRDELHRNEKDLDRLLERARQVSTLKHPNIREVLSVFVEEERVHIVSEAVDGKPLSEFLAPGRRINLGPVKKVLLQASRAVEHAHAAKILHGDLSPACITVTREGSAKVGEFGIGIEARKSAAKLSWGEPIGSPAYLAPEQELGSAFKESDVFSLGVLLYEMAVGALPYEGPNYLAQKRERRVKPPSQAAPGLPRELDEVVLRALSPEPQNRFRTAEDFGKALAKLPDA